jgi:hypothetical protein
VLTTGLAVAGMESGTGIFDLGPNLPVPVHAGCVATSEKCNKSHLSRGAASMLAGGKFAKTSIAIDVTRQPPSMPRIAYDKIHLVFSIDVC